MNKIVRGKKGLIWVGIACFALAILGLVSGILILVSSAKSIAVAVSVGNVFGVIGGIVLCLMSFGFIAAGIYFVWIGNAIKAINGSIKEGDLCKGTVNMKKCPECGSEIADGDKVCGQCGESLAKTKICPACGKEVDSSKTFCPECGIDMMKVSKKKD